MERWLPDSETKWHRTMCACTYLPTKKSPPWITYRLPTNFFLAFLFLWEYLAVIKWLRLKRIYWVSSQKRTAMQRLRNSGEGKTFFVSQATSVLVLRNWFCFFGWASVWRWPIAQESDYERKELTSVASEWMQRRWLNTKKGFNQLDDQAWPLSVFRIFSFWVKHFLAEENFRARFFCFFFFFLLGLRFWCKIFFFGTRENCLGSPRPTNLWLRRASLDHRCDSDQRNDYKRKRKTGVAKPTTENSATIKWP